MVKLSSITKSPKHVEIPHFTSHRFTEHDSPAKVVRKTLYYVMADDGTVYRDASLQTRRHKATDFTSLKKAREFAKKINASRDFREYMFRKERGAPLAPGYPSVVSKNFKPLQGID